VGVKNAPFGFYFLKLKAAQPLQQINDLSLCYIEYFDSCVLEVDVETKI
jgi:hypothetical protein